jgi:hypothetical protein
MDRRNYQFWRKKLRRVDETTAKFDLLVPILKKYLAGDVSIENVVICEKIFSFREKFDKKLDDPVWETVSLKIKKYVPFLNIDVFHYKKLLRKIVNE